MAKAKATAGKIAQKMRFFCFYLHMSKKSSKFADLLEKHRKT